SASPRHVVPNHTKPHPPANGGTTTTNTSGCQRRTGNPRTPTRAVPTRCWGRAKDKFLFYHYYFLLSTIEKDDGDRPAARRRTETQPTPPYSQHQTTSNRPVNARTRPNDEEEEAERGPHPTANGGTTTTTTTKEEERQGNHDGKGEPRGGGPGRTTRPTTESGARYAPDAIPIPPTYNPPQTNVNPEPAPYRRTKTRTSASPGRAR